MEGSASAPTHPHIELEPPEWQPRAVWVSARQLCGAASFFFIAFVFAYFYLRSLDSNHDWKIGHNINPSLGLGVLITVLLVISAVAMRISATQQAHRIQAGLAAMLLAILAIVLQVVSWTKLGFGPASGAYASVYVGWTGCYTVFMLFCVYWIETQVATVWRRRRDGLEVTPGHVLDATDVALAGLRACSFFWTYYVLNGVILFVVLYLL